VIVVRPIGIASFRPRASLDRGPVASKNHVRIIVPTRALSIMVAESAW
jgi:hypothetical protein